MAGVSDVPVKKLEDDCFNLEKYVKGLAGYIGICETPTTIAVQGDWGCGKTSMLNMVKEYLGGSVKPIWFNTWQYSKFNMDDNLSLSLLTHLYMELARQDGEAARRKMSEKLVSLAKITARASSYVIDFLGAQKIAEDIGKISEADFEQHDLIETIATLKDEFQTTINRIYQNTGKRVVVFIDDLDRLSPAKAVDLMEVLKLFLDCENCVYVLAIDYDIVTRGISEKYGADFGEKQGKRFFDKIIQVPFFVPVEQYPIEKYLKKSLPDSFRISDEDMPQYVKLIRYSVGCNPRSMKRLINAYLLITMIYNDQELDSDPVKKKLLFAILCLQISMSSLYKDLIERSGELDASFFEIFDEEPSDGSLADYFASLSQDDELDEGNAVTFMRELSAIVRNPGGEGSAAVTEKLKAVLHVSSSTNNTAIQTRKGPEPLLSDAVKEITINPTNINYKIFTAGADFHIGFSENVTLRYNGKSYPAKMHSKTKGRIDGLSELFKDANLQQNDVCILQYDFKKKEITCTVKNRS